MENLLCRADLLYSSDEVVRITDEGLHVIENYFELSNLLDSVNPNQVRTTWYIIV